MDLIKIQKFIKKQKVSFICSIDENGFPNIKAMLKPRKINGLKEFYFSTNTSSLRVKQFLSNPNASIYFYRKGLIKYTGVMLVGKMEVLTDQKTKDMIWRKGDTMFYKKGVTDPDYCVLKFTAQKGRYYCDLKTESFEVCGKCEKLCPMNNIKIVDNKVVQNNQCTMCYRCINNCPKQAMTLLGKNVVEQSVIEKYL